MIPLLAGLPWSGIAVAGALTTLLGLAYCAGVEDTKQAVTQRNQAVERQAEKAQLSVDQCFDKGGRWDVVKGACDR